WTDFGGGGETDGSGSHIRAQIFDANGAAVGNEFIVNSTTVNDQLEPTVTALANGGLAVALTNPFTQKHTDTLIPPFTANGTPKANDFFIDGTANSNESAVSMIGLADGNLFVTWQDAGSALESDGSGSHIRGRILSGIDGSGLSDEFIINSTTAGDQSQ